MGAAADPYRITMHYSIFDSGALLGSYENEGEAMQALVTLASADPAHADTLVFVAFDDAGQRVGTPVLGSYLCSE
jgi:hypothetical protein